jgi:hypothetical protein
VIQGTHTILLFKVGLIERAWPVQASNAARCATIQSTVPFKFTTANDVMGDRTDIKAVRGLVDDIFHSQSKFYLREDASYPLIQERDSQQNSSERLQDT